MFPAMRYLHLIPLAAVLAMLLAAPASADLARVVDALKVDGRVLLMRHAQTHSGIGDPSNFDLNDCSTQRNLDHRGREQSRRLGAALKAGGVTIAKALSSGWCRCRETARIILDEMGETTKSIETFEPLNSFFEDRRPRDRRVREANAAIAAWSGKGVLLMSTHMVNISGMTGRGVASGEVLVLQPTGDGYEIVASGTPGY